MAAVPLREAAAELGKSTATVRRWLRQGAPSVQRGGRGPGRAARVDVAALKRWRAGAADHSEVLERVAGALVDTLMRDGGEGEPAHVTLAIPRRRAAALLAVAYERIHRAITGRDAASLPPQIERAVCVLPSLRT